MDWKNRMVEQYVNNEVSLEKLIEYIGYKEAMKARHEKAIINREISDDQGACPS